jgi:hypothetical protein
MVRLSSSPCVQLGNLRHSCHLTDVWRSCMCPWGASSVPQMKLALNNSYTSGSVLRIAPSAKLNFPCSSSCGFLGSHVGFVFVWSPCAHHLGVWIKLMEPLQGQKHSGTSSKMASGVSSRPSSPFLAPGCD